MKLSGYQSLVTLRAECSNRAEANGVSSDGMQQAEALSIMNQIDTVLGTLVEQEKDPRVRGALGLE
jgi:hypothetical protein